jgi:hypothetical protein
VCRVEIATHDYFAIVLDGNRIRASFDRHARKEAGIESGIDRSEFIEPRCINRGTSIQSPKWPPESDGIIEADGQAIDSAAGA